MEVFINFIKLPPLFVIVLLDILKLGFAFAAIPPPPPRYDVFLNAYDPNVTE